MQYNEQPLTLQDIREVPTNYLRACLKDSTDRDHVYDMMQVELNRRNTRRRIN
jgi:hypothetical protein